MGLDISLCRSDDWEYSLRAHGIKMGELEGVPVIDWRKGDPGSDELRERNMSFLDFCRRNGLRCRVWQRGRLPVFEIDTGIQDIGCDLRSSYNDHGVNNVLRRAGLPDYYGIFGQEVDPPWHAVVDWDRSLAMAKDTLGKFLRLDLGERDMEYVGGELWKTVVLCEMAITDGRERCRLIWSA